MALKILLIDDDAEICAATAEMLEKKGYIVSAVGTGEAALEAVRHEIPDMIVTDYRLPGMNGDVITDELKSSPATEHVMILMCTAMPAMAQPLGGNPRLRRPDDYLIKPFSAADLLEKIRSLTGG